MWAESFVPSAIREFFFDGERLDNYFKEVKGQNVKTRFLFYHISIFRVWKRIDQIFKELRRIGKLDPEIDKKEKLEEKQETQ